MPTARELLEQADALMKRNRAREQEQDIPELTDEVAVAAVASPSLRESSLALRSAPRQRNVRTDDVPELHDAVEELSIQPLPDHEGEVSRWLEVDLGEVSITGPAPDSIAVVPPSTLRVRPPAPRVELPPKSAAERHEPPVPAPAPPPLLPVAAASVVAAKVAGNLSGRPAEPPPASDPAFDAMLGVTPKEAALTALPVVPDPVPPPVVAATTVPDAERWEGLAEEIRMQVLQRIDIFTDTGLHGELSARLQPIVDRASVDLVTTINREVGQILRAYVAEAIEREIEKWREANP